MQRSLIKPAHAYVPRNTGQRRYVSRIENGVVAYWKFLFGIPIPRTESLEDFARWAHEDAELRDRRQAAAALQ